MADKATAVKVQELSKSFRIPLEASSGIKQKLVNALKGRKGYREFTPLNNISFEIEKGDFFGIVGRNGSGKSTLLKTIAGIYAPNHGLVQVNGTLVPFIELGVGFNPELTGRENVFLNGALLGFSREEMEAMYDDIVDFAELHDFMEERLKNYSSGMQVRLAFSIAIRAEGDVLLLDEVLAVGDEAFQRKCFSYFEQLKQEKKTVILVTHDMASVERFCTKAMLIDKGKIVAIGRPHTIATKYTNLNLPEKEVDTKKPSLDKKDTSKPLEIVIADKSGAESSYFLSGDDVQVLVTWGIDGVYNVGVALIKKTGEYIYATNTFVDGESINGKSVGYKFKASLSEGEYSIMIGLFGKNDKETILLVDDAGTFVVNKNPNDNRWEGLVKLDSEWNSKNV